ncbi:MAG TPA: hypothetical protein DEP84_29880 [Chloroflexi bacterium]|nr:hypothetical protein [Chloroflexota bacterium]
MHFQYIPYIWLLLVSAAVTAVLGVYAWRHRTVPGAAPFSVLMLAVVAWTLANALEMAGTDLSTKLFWANVQYLSYVPVSTAWLALALQYTGRDEWLTRRNLALLLIVPILIAVLAWTNDLHGWLRRNVHLDSAGSFPVVGKTYGPFFWIHVAYNYGLLLVTAFLFVKALRHAPSLYRKQTLVLLIGLLMPLPWSVLYGLSLSPVPRHDLSPAVFGLSGVVVAWGLFRYRLFDLMPVARATVVEGMGDSVIVLDAQNRIVDLNPAAQEVLGWTASRAIGQPATEVFNDWPELVALCRDPTATQTELVRRQGEAEQHYDSRRSSLTDRRGRSIGQVILLHDITDRKRAEVQLLQQQRALAVLQERERLARELHDGLSQVLGYVKMQAQAARELLSRDQTATADAHLARLAAVAQDAHTDVRESILNLGVATLPERGFLPALEESLQRFEQNSGIRTELAVPAELVDQPFEPIVEVQLLRIIQEALTNVRKHAGARSVRVAFTIHAGHAQVVVEDDGRGLDPGRLPAGGEQKFGLRFMRERAEEVGGNVQMHSASGEGTKVTVRVPRGG